MARVSKKLSLDEAAVQRGERYCAIHGTNLSQLVSDFLTGLPVDEGVTSLPPLVRRLIGIGVSDMSRDDAGRETQAYRNHLAESMAIREKPLKLDLVKNRLRLLIDTNIILDLSLARSLWLPDAAALLVKIERETIVGFIAAHTITTAFRLSLKQKGRNAATRALISIYSCSPSYLRPLLISSARFR